MKEVYLVIESYFAENAGTFEEVLSVWADKTEAELCALELREMNGDDYPDYYVHTFEVK